MMLPCLFCFFLLFASIHGHLGIRNVIRGPVAAEMPPVQVNIKLVPAAVEVKGGIHDGFEPGVPEASDTSEDVGKTVVVAAKSTRRKIIPENIHRVRVDISKFIKVKQDETAKDSIASAGDVVRLTEEVAAPTKVFLQCNIV